jgi:low temperature requirement protein LtrA
MTSTAAEDTFQRNVSATLDALAQDKEPTENVDLIIKDEDVEHGSLLPIMTFQVPRRLEFVPLDWQRAKRVPPPFLMGDALGSAAREFWEKHEHRTDYGLRNGFYPQQWWEKSTYYYLDQLKREVKFNDLFFDLVFVTLIARGGDRLAETLTWLALARHLVIFYCLFETWHFASSITNMLYTHSTIQRCVTFAFIVFAVFMGNFTYNCFNLDLEFDTTTQFVTVFLLAGAVRIFILLLMAWQIPVVRKNVLYKSFLILLCASGWVASAMLPGDLGLQLILWWVSTTLQIFIVWIFDGFCMFPSHMNIVLNPDHWTERLHLFTLIAAGEGVTQAVVDVNATQPWAQGMLLSFSAILVMSVLTWLYFAAEGNSGHVLIHATRRSGFLSSLWTMLHFFLILSSVAVANSFKILSRVGMHTWEPETPRGPQTNTEALSAGRWLLCGSTALYILYCVCISACHFTIFDQNKQVLEAQYRAQSESSDPIPTYFWDRNFKYFKYIIQLLIGCLVLIPGLEPLNFSAEGTLGYVAGMCVLLAIVEEVYGNVFGLEIEIVQHLEKRE